MLDGKNTYDNKNDMKTLNNSYIIPTETLSKNRMNLFIEEINFIYY